MVPFSLLIMDILERVGISLAVAPQVIKPWTALTLHKLCLLIGPKLCGSSSGHMQYYFILLFSGFLLLCINAVHLLGQTLALWSMCGAPKPVWIRALAYTQHKVAKRTNEQDSWQQQRLL